MRKSLFAGLTVLEPDDSILDDGGAFGGRDREIIDRLLRLGAKTHRHDGSPGLGDPVSEMGASAIGSAGSLPADVQLSISYTLEDDALGETLIAPPVMISTPPPIEPPMFALQVEADHSAGNLLTETYYYAYSYVDGEGGETPISPVESGKRQPGFPNGRMLISGLTNGMVEAGATGWRLYRAVGGGNLHLLTEGDGDTYIDDGTDSVDCDIAPLREAINSTNGSNSVLLALPSADAFVDEASFINVYISEDGDFAERDILLDSYPVSSAGEHVLLPTLDLIEGRPPDANMSIGGANLIDPDTELLEWTWKRPVLEVTDLPSGTHGDIRLVHGASALYYLPADGASHDDWELLVSEEGTGGSLGAVEDDTTQVLDPTSVVFADGRGAAVTVSDFGGGSARVLIESEEGTVRAVEDNGGIVALDPAAVAFTASGGAAVAVSDAGGSAQVLIAIADEEIDAIPETLIDAKGDLIVGAADDVAGRLGIGTNGHVLTLDSGEPLGIKWMAAPGAAGGIDPSIFTASGQLIGASGVAGPVIIDSPVEDGLVLTASGGVESGIGWGPLMPEREDSQVVTGSLVDDASETLDFPLATGFRLLAIETSHAARVQLYVTGGDRTADAARPVGTDPTGDHGVILDFVTEPGDLQWRLSPVVDGASMDDPPTTGIACRVTNRSGSTTAITVTVTFVRTES